MSRDRLAFYPYVVVRVNCRHCTRHGSYRLARLGAKYGPEIDLENLLPNLPAIARCGIAPRDGPKAAAHSSRISSRRCARPICHACRFAS
jgi:hypothetical protein